MSDSAGSVFVDIPVLTTATIDGILPTEINDILQSPGNGVKLFGKNYDDIIIVAFIRSIQRFASKVVYLLEDNSGNITATQWLQPPHSCPIALMHTHCRVIGTVYRQTEGGKEIVISHIQRVDTHVIRIHYEEVWNARLFGEYFFNKIELLLTSDNSGVILPTNLSWDYKCRAVFSAIKKHIVNPNEILQKLPFIVADELGEISEYLMQLMIVCYDT